MATSRFELAIDGERWAGYTFRLAYEPQTGEVIEFGIARRPGSGQLTAHELQRVPLGTLERTARRHVAEFLTEWDECRPDVVQRLYPRPEDWLDAIADARTAPEADVRLARLCKRYLELDGRPGWRETLAGEFHYDPSGIQTIISRARARRFLTPVPQRQYGGQLTPKALRLLAPPRMQTAWERASDEQRAAAVERDEGFKHRFEGLIKELDAGRIDSETYHRRFEDLFAETYGSSAPHGGDAR